MTTEYLFTSDLDDTRVLEALQRIDSAVDALVKSANAKFATLQGGLASGLGVGATAVSSSPTRVSSSTPELSAARQDKAELEIVKAVLDVRRKILEIEKAASTETRAARKAETDAVKASLAIVRQAQAIEKATNAEARAVRREELSEEKTLLQIERQRQVIAAAAAAAVRQAAKEREQAAVNEAKLQQQVLQLEKQRLALAEARFRAGKTTSSQFGDAISQAPQETALRLQQARNVAAQQGFAVAQAQLRLEIQETQVAKQQVDAERQITEEKKRGNRESGDPAKRIALLTNAYHLLGQAILSTTRHVTEFFRRIVSDSVKAAVNIESVGVSFGAVFGDLQVGAAVLEDIRQTGLRLGEDITVITRRILPLVSSIQQAEEIATLAAGLGRLDPQQGTAGALIAINEALTGNLRSLRERFELPVGDIKDAQAELGIVNGLIEGLGDTLQARGLDFETLADTAQVTTGRTRQYVTFLKEEFGEPILEEWSEQFKDFNNFLDENQTNIRVVVDALGDLVAKFIELAGTGINNIFDNLDFAALEEKIASLSGALTLIKDIIAGFGGQANIPSPFKEWIQDAFTLEKAVRAVAQAVGILDAYEAKRNAANQEASRIQEERGLHILTAAERAQVAAAGEAAFAETILQVNDALNRSIDSADASRQAMEDRREELEKSRDAELELANAIAASNLAERGLEDAQGNLKEKQTEVGLEIGDAQEKFAQDVADAQLDAERKRLDIEEDFAQKRVDLARKNAQEISDIIRDYNNDVADAARDLARKEQEILRKGAQKLGDIEQERAQKKIDIEEDFQRRLQEIRRKFDFDAEEAIRANDAVALLRIRRRMNFELEEAKIARDQRLTDEDEARNEAFEKERTNIQRLLEEARIANAERLEDLQINLARRLEEQQIAYDRELEELAINEQRKQEEVKKSLDRQLEDLSRELARRVEELTNSLQLEVKAVQDAEAAKLKAFAAATAAFARLAFERGRAIAAATAAGQAAGGGSLLGGDLAPGESPSKPTGKNPVKGPGTEEPSKPPTKADKGGTNPNAGTPADPNFASSRIIESPPTASQTNIINNSRTNISLGLSDPSQMSPAQIRTIQNIATQVVREALS